MKTSTTKRAITIVLSLFIVVSIGAALWKLLGYAGIGQGLGSVYFFYAAALAVLYRLVNPLGWVAVLRGFGHRVHAAAATNIWLMAESRRWLPGGVWGYTSRAVRSQELGVSKSVASASMLVELVVTLLAAVVVSIFGLALHYDAVGTMVHEAFTQYFSWNGVILAPTFGAAMIGACYSFRGKLAEKFQSLNEKWQLLDLSQVSFRRLAVALGYFVLMACLNGAVNLVMLRTCTDVQIPVTAIIAATAAAWVIGYLAFFSPGGLFVREGALAMLLMPWIPYETAFTLAILSRVAQLLAEVICMGVPLLSRYNLQEAAVELPNPAA